MGNRPKYFEFVNTLRQSQLGEPARIRSIFHNETREKHEKQPKSSLTKARRARRNSHRIFLGGNSRKQRAPPILLCVSVPLCETPSAVVDSLRSLRSLRQMRLPLGNSRRVLAPKNAKSAEKQPQNFWGEQPKTTSPSYSALCLCASVRDVFGCCRLRDSEREGFEPPSRLRRIRFSRPAR